MSKTILCQIKRADSPYYIEDIDLYVYSIEELCYFLCNNLNLVDVTFFGAALLDWLGADLQMAHLVKTLNRILDEEENPSAEEMILAVVREIRWLDREEEKKLIGQMETLAARPYPVRRKLRADALVTHQKYTRAIATYTGILRYRKETAASEEEGAAVKDNLGEQFDGMVWHNMGVAYAKLFQFDEAAECMKRANELCYSHTTLVNYLFCVRLGKGEEAFEKLADELGVDGQTRQKMEAEIENVRFPGFPENIRETINRWVHEYHRQTGL
ncbi:MAG: hypothetical protein UHN88_05345 [Eubacterium sp.]|nr:hypothetical protein [Eubacterium sp.]